MMKIKKLIAAGCAMILALTGCGAKEETPASAAKESSVVSSAEAKESSVVSSAVASEKPDEAQKVKLTIDGYDKDNFPRLDGSLANEPLLLRIIGDLTDTDADTAEVYLADSFENGGTSTSWGKLLYDSMDLIISYEPPQEV